MSFNCRICIYAACSAFAVMLTGCGGSEPDPAVAAALSQANEPAPASSGAEDSEDSGEGEGYGGDDENYGAGSYGGGDYGGEGAGYGGEGEGEDEGSYGGESQGGMGGYSMPGGPSGGGSGRPSLGGMAPGGGGGMGGYSMPGGPDGGYEGEGAGMAGYSMGGGVGYGAGNYGGEEGQGMYGYGGEDSELGGTGGPGMGFGGGGLGFGGGPGMGAQGGGGPHSQMMQFVSQNCFSCHGRGQSKGGVSLAGLNPDFSNADNADLWNDVAGVVEDGSMPPQNRLSQQQRSQFVDMVKKALEESGALGTDYLADAKRSFGKGREKEALEYLYAHIVTADDEEAKELLQQTRWFAYGKRPTTTLRFATGIVLDAPSTLTDIQPIGSGQQNGMGGFGGEGMGMGMGRGGRNSNAGNGQRSFTSLTGDMGKAMVGAFESRWTSGNLGTIFSEVVYSAPSRQSNNAFGGGGNSGGRGFGGGMGMGMGMGMGGPGGDYGGEGQGFGGPGYGAGVGYGGEGMGPGGPGGGAGYGGESYGGEGLSNNDGTVLANVRENIMPGQTVTPGLIYLGVASQADLLTRAKARGVDAVFVFDIKASRNRFQQVNNDTRIRLVPIEGKPLGATKILKNTEVERARQRGGDDDVQKNIDRLFSGFDDNFKLASMPNFKPEHAQGRIRSLLAQREALPEDEEQEMDMTVLFETRLFHSMGLLTSEQLSMIYQIILRGNEGETLATGTVEDKQMVLEGFLTSL